MKISPPAFPTYLAENMAHGMTLRDYFAANVMQSLISKYGFDRPNEKDIPKNFLKHVACCSYIMADEMLKVREE